MALEVLVLVDACGRFAGHRLRVRNECGEDGSFDGFLRALQNGRIASALRQGGDGQDRGGTAGSPRIRGTTTLLRGQYEFAGRNFRLSRGPWRRLPGEFTGP